MQQPALADLRLLQRAGRVELVIDGSQNSIGLVRARHEPYVVASGLTGIRHNKPLIRKARTAPKDRQRSGADKGKTAPQTFALASPRAAPRWTRPMAHHGTACRKTPFQMVVESGAPGKLVRMPEGKNPNYAFSNAIAMVKPILNLRRLTCGAGRPLRR